MYDEPEPIEMPITDELDLHTFKPGEISELLEDYFEECIKLNLLSVRIIHGKGRGHLKRGVIEKLKRCPRVKSFCPAPPGAGGWGATLVELHSDTRSEDT